MTDDERQNALALTVFALLGCQQIAMGQRARFEVSDSVLDDFNPKEWEVRSFRLADRPATVFELVERRGAFDMTAREMEKLTHVSQASAK